MVRSTSGWKIQLKYLSEFNFVFNIYFINNIYRVLTFWVSYPVGVEPDPDPTHEKRLNPYPNPIKTDPDPTLENKPGPDSEKASDSAKQPKIFLFFTLIIIQKDYKILGFHFSTTWTRIHISYVRIRV